jgi:hypothetical protein
MSSRFAKIFSAVEPGLPTPKDLLIRAGPGKGLTAKARAGINRMNTPILSRKIHWLNW